MKKPVKWILIGIIAVITIVGTIWYMRQPVNVGVVWVEPKTAELYFIEQGVASVERNVEVYAMVQGRLERVEAVEDQRVAAGDVLCVIDSSELLAQLAQTESSIKGYQAQMDNLDIEERRNKESMMSDKNSLLGELKALQAQEATGSLTVEDQRQQLEEQIRLQTLVISQNEEELSLLQREQEKAAILFTMGVLSEQEYDVAVKAVEAQDNLLAVNRQQLTVIQSGEVLDNNAYYSGAKQAIQARIEGIDATLAGSYTGAMKEYYIALIEGGQAAMEQITRQIGDCTVTAPVSGIVTSLYVKDTNKVNAASPVAVITPDEKVVVEVYVSTSDIDEIAIGQQVDLILKRRGGDKVYASEITAVGNEAEVKFSVLGVEERRVKVTITPMEGFEDIKPGYDMDVKFVSYREADRLTVPKTAFFTVNDREMVWVIRGGKAVMTEVKKGRELRTEYVVEQGLQTGDRVIVDADAEGVKEGANVTGS